MIFWLMTVGCVVIGTLALLDLFDHTVFWLEALILVLFVVFWVVQTWERWKTSLFASNFDDLPVAITVTDLERSKAWYARVLDWTPVMDGGGNGVVFCVGEIPGGPVFGLRQNADGGGDAFDPILTGLDHLAFPESSIAEMPNWERRFSELGVTYEPTEKTPDGFVLNFKARTASLSRSIRPTSNTSGRRLISERVRPKAGEDMTSGPDEMREGRRIATALFADVVAFDCDHRAARSRRCAGGHRRRGHARDRTDRCPWRHGQRPGWGRRARPLGRTYCSRR